MQFLSYKKCLWITGDDFESVVELSRRMLKFWGKKSKFTNVQFKWMLEAVIGFFIPQICVDNFSCFHFCSSYFSEFMQLEVIRDHPRTNLCSFRNFNIFYYATGMWIFHLKLSLPFVDVPRMEIILKLKLNWGGRKENVIKSVQLEGRWSLTNTKDILGNIFVDCIKQNYSSVCSTKRTSGGKYFEY